MKTANALELPSKPKIGMISLGCAKNIVDAKIMLGSASAFAVFICVYKSWYINVAVMLSEPKHL